MPKGPAKPHHGPRDLDGAAVSARQADRDLYRKRARARVYRRGGSIMVAMLAAVAIVSTSSPTGTRPIWSPVDCSS